MRLEKFESYGYNIHFRTTIGSTIGKNINLPSRRFRYFTGDRINPQCKKDNNYYNDSTSNNKYYL